jgi:hypothetical protein
MHSFTDTYASFDTSFNNFIFLYIKNPLAIDMYSAKTCNVKTDDIFSNVFSLQGSLGFNLNADFQSLTVSLFQMYETLSFYLQ